MSSIVTPVFKATIGLLVNKGRDKAAENLREGDVTDQKFPSVIVREIDDIKSKLDGLSRKDLLAGISFFEEGIELLYEVVDKARSRNEGDEEPVQAACAEAFALTEGMRNVELTGLNESATRALANAKERFKESRREATRAFKNEALATSDRILAMQYRVMATILETVDNPEDAIAPCRVCIKELNCLPAVQNSFDVQLRKGIMAVKAFFSKDERRKIICSVCHVNRVIFDVTQAVGRDEPFWMWPAVDTGEGNVDPLRDGKIVKVLRKQGMEHCFLAPWSFGQEGEEEHKLKDLCAIATNSKGQFIIADRGNSNVKVFDRRGQFIDHFSLPVDDVDQDVVRLFDVASDMKDNFYVVVVFGKPTGGGSEPCFVYKFNYTGEVLHKFAVKWRSSLVSWILQYGTTLAVDGKGKVMCRSEEVVDVYENDGQFVRSFGEGLLYCSHDLTCASDGRVMLLDSSNSVHVFSEHGDHISEFKLEGCSCFPRIAFHHSSEHVVVADKEKNCLYVKIYTKDGELVHSAQIHTARIFSLLGGMAVTTEGHIAVMCKQFKSCEWKVFIV